MGSASSQIWDFLKRVTAPDADPLDYSNAGRRLSPDKPRNFRPWPNAYLSQFASSLDDYTSAVNEYRQAMNLNYAWEATKDVGIKILKYSIRGAATAYAIKSAFSR